jgi:hypothetical protein
VLRVILFLLFLLPGIAHADSLSYLTSPVKPLRWGTLYENPLANPYSPEFSIVRDSKARIQAKFGGGIGLVNYDDKIHHWQLGVEASAWITLGYKDGSFPLLTEDFIFSVPFAYKYYQTTFVLKWNHISAHLGDGSRREPIIYSRDFISFHIAREYKNRYSRSKVYLHLGDAYRIYPKRLSGKFIGGGIESNLKTGWIRPYIAFETNYNRDVFSLDLSGQIGLQLERRLPGSLEARVAVIGYYGRDRRGQMLGRKLSTVGVGIFIR